MRELKTVTLSEMTAGKEWVGLGIAGNQAGHLDQAGESGDFREIQAEENAPKGIFPWYVSGVDSFLGVNPLSSDRLVLSEDGAMQIEPEVALVVEFHYSEEPERLIEGLSVLGFTAFNDCSRRVPAAKISLKKNWGEATQGMAEAVVELADFSEKGGKADSYRLGCYLKRDGELFQYGEDTALVDYTYFHQELIDWIVKQINGQEDQGPLENIRELMAPRKAKFGVIGIGASRYSDFGNSEERFLRVGDESIVVVYEGEKYSRREVEALIEGAEGCSDVLLLRQVLVREGD